MKLLELRANKDSFRTVTFNKKGISLITAIKESSDQKKTYNSVGKSLTIELIHFCLGANKNTEFQKKLKGWEFYLDFEINGKRYTSKRSTDKQERIYLDEKELSLAKFKNFMLPEVFNVDKEIKFLKFRSLISRFIRPAAVSYVSYDRFVDRETPINELMVTSFLLGLNVEYILKKFNLKKDLDDIDSSIKNIKKDGIIKSYLKADGGKDSEIEIVSLERKLKKLTDSIKQFKIAKDYYDIQKQADSLSREIKELKNQAVVLKNAIENINKSLHIKPDITKEKIEKLYSEATYTLPEEITKRLSDLEEFNKKLLDNRSAKLLEEKRRFQERLKELEIQIEKIGKDEDVLLQYLNTHGALEEYTQLNKQSSDISTRLEKLKTYSNLLNEYEAKKNVIKKEFLDQDALTSIYLKENKSLIEENISLFQELAEQFYTDKPAGISIENNTGMNSLRFDIRAKIRDDAGDAVNEVKIFCFDWTILKSQHNHHVKFLFHDSKITDGVDPRQIATMFKIAFDECFKEDFQYIISANQNVLDSLKEEFSEEEYKLYISDNIILELSDKSDSEKLLGIQIDIDYQKEYAELDF